MVAVMLEAREKLAPKLAPRLIDWKAPAVLVIPFVAAFPKVLATAFAVDVAWEALVEVPPVALRLSVALAPTPSGFTSSERLTPPAIDLNDPSVEVSP